VAASVNVTLGLANGTLPRFAAAAAFLLAGLTTGASILISIVIKNNTLMSQEKILSKVALFEYASTQNDPIEWLQGQLYPFAPQHSQHFLLMHSFPNKEQRRRQRIAVVAQYKTYREKLRKPGESYESALARLFVLCPGFTLADALWESNPELVPEVVTYVNENITMNTKLWNADVVLQSPAGPLLDPLRDPLYDRNVSQFHRKVLDPLHKAVPPLSIVKLRMGSAAAEHYRELIEDEHIICLNDALEAGTKRTWTTQQCEARVKLLFLLHEAHIASAETGMPVEMAALNYKI
jgi:hypothetical protein